MQVSNQYVSNNVPSKATARLVGHEGPICAIKFSHDGKYCISAGHDRTVRLWNPTRIDPAFSHKCNIYGESLSVSSANANENSIESIPHALPIQSYRDGHTHPISSIDIDDTSTTLISSSSKSLVVTDVITQKLKRRFQGHTGLINTVACSSGGSVFASGSYDGTVRIMDGRSFSTNPIQVLTEAKDSVSCVKILEKGNAVAELVSVSVDGTIRTYDLRKGCVNQDSFGQDVSLTSIAFSSDWLSSSVSSLNGVIYVLEKETGDLINTCVSGHKAGRYSLDCMITADDQHIVSGSEDGCAVLYDFVSGKVVQRLKGHKRATCAVTTHPNRNHSSVVITGSYDGDAVVWSNGDPIYLSEE
jgi:mitogen-activated protein kinase organizer 1